MGVVALAHLCRSCSFGSAALWIAGWVCFTSFCKGEGSKIAGLDRLVERIDRGELDLISAGRAPFADSDLARQLPDADFGALKNPALSGRLRRSQPMTRRVRRSRV